MRKALRLALASGLLFSLGLWGLSYWQVYYAVGLLHLLLIVAVQAGTGIV